MASDYQGGLFKIIAPWGKVLGWRTLWRTG